jgi:DNA primase
LVSKYVSLKKAGVNFKGLCPFHKEKTPSFIVSPQKEIFHCFGCGQGGNVFTFLQEMEKISFIEAVRMLASSAGVDISEYQYKGGDKSRARINDQLFKTNSLALEYFRKTLASPRGRNAREYLEKRSLSQSLIERFQLGYAPDTGSGLLNYLYASKTGPEVLRASGLFGISGDNRLYDKFRNRIIFPIHNLSGLVVGFGGRALGRGQEPKYLNSPDTPVFKKGELLYGLNQSKQAVRRGNSAILVEGYMDYLALANHGFENIVATCGTSLTEAQSYLIKRFCREIIILYDGDEAGLNAAERSIPLFLNKELLVKIVCLPADQDPDDLLERQGRERMQELIDKSGNVVDFMVFRRGGSGPAQTPEKKSLLADNILEILNEIPNPVTRGEYIKVAARRLDIAEDILNQRMIDLERRRRRTVEKNDEPSTGREAKPSRQHLFEESIIAQIMLNPEDCLDQTEKLSPENFSEPLFKKIFIQEIENRPRQPSDFMDQLNASEQSFVTRMLLKSQDSAFDPGRWIGLVQNFRIFLTRESMKRIKDQIKRGAQNKAALLEEFNRFTNVLKELQQENGVH